MVGKARLGQWVLLTIFVATALSELALAGLSLQAGRFRGAQVGRVLLTGWLLWKVWDGAGWARWVVASLFLAGAVFGVAVGITSPAVQQRPEFMALLIGVVVVLLAFAAGLASPWVGAFQSACRGSEVAKPDDASDSPSPTPPQ